MNDPIALAAARFREAITRAIVPLQTTRTILADELITLEKTAGEVAKLLKGHDLVSKSLLNEFLVSARVLRNEAAFFGNERSRIEGVAQKIEDYLALILRDEVPGLRVPGVPRVI